MGLEGRIRRGENVLIELGFGGGIYRKIVKRRVRDAFVGGDFEGMEWRGWRGDNCNC
jgi:hypothetical protein